MSRQLPGSTEYQSALQNLSVTMVLPELKQYNPVKGKRGQNLIYSGGFAMTCPIQNPQTGSKYALRFFTSLPEDIEARYAAISKFITQHYDSGLFAEIEYEPEGVLIQGQRYPICKMEWLEGVTLRVYVSRHINDPNKMNSLADKFHDLIQKISKLGIAHGDLSHENIMVVQDELMLVDYDGMYLPDLASRGPVVAGQKNFQHPQRFQEGGYFGPYQDDFSAIVIYLSLLSLRYNTSFFDRYENGGNSLLFKADDFINPDSSDYLREMEQYPDLAPLVQTFRNVCREDIRNVPSLRDFMRGKHKGIPRQVATAPLPQGLVFDEGNNPVFNASAVNKELLLRSVGHVGTLAGRINEVKIEDDYVLFGFTSGVEMTSAAILLGDAFEEIMNEPDDPIQKYTGTWVKATGPIQIMEIAGEQQPIAEIESLNAVVISDRTTVTAAASGQQVKKTSEAEKKIYRRPPQQQSRSSKFDPKGGAFGSIDDL